MAKAKPRSTSKRTTLNSYFIEFIQNSIKPGDCVLMKPEDPSNPPYVAKVEAIESAARGGDVRVYVRWYYRPEDAGGRLSFHGSKELFFSDHFDVQSAVTIVGMCTVHSLQSYIKLDSVGKEDYFCRFVYDCRTRKLTPDPVAVYCKCEKPYNPDHLMIQCEGCNDWFHPGCLDMLDEEAERLNHFFCLDCSPENSKLHNAHVASTHSDVKVEAKRRRR